MLTGAAPEAVWTATLAALTSRPVEARLATLGHLATAQLASVPALAPTLVGLHAHSLRAAARLADSCARATTRRKIFIMH